MELRLFGTTKRFVPRIGHGTWYIEEGHRPSAVAALRRGIDVGMTHIDTAEMYGAGAAEELVGEAIAGRRNEVFLVSKVLPQNASRSGTRLACEASLTRLDTDRLDCYLLHWRGSYPLEETIAGFDDLQRAGKILSWGVSNFDVPDLGDALMIGGDGEGRLACNQVLYHLQQRGIEHAVLPWCETHGVAVTGYSPFGHGRLPEAHTEGGRLLARIAEAYDATPRQVALAFLTRRPSLFTIPKASTPQHAEENAGAGDLKLSADEIALIDAAFPRGPRPRALPVL
jgi:diketogulonate reductase-like aldo/keto reductase